MTTQAKPKRLPKLPDVWVAFDEVTQTTPEEVRFYKFPRGVRYTPSKPRKAQVCAWTDAGDFRRTGCLEEALYPIGFDYDYCPRCSGKVKL
jgi:hypothetical protein